VYKLSPSDKLCFAAGDYLHATIIPEQTERWYSLLSMTLFHTNKSVLII
jgi:hypothetical protein